MIDVSLHIEKLDRLSKYMDYFINKKCSDEDYIMRIITDVKVPFPDYYTWVDYDRLIEVSNERWNDHPRQGWGTKGPDKMIGNDIELFKLSRPSKPIPFS